MNPTSDNFTSRWGNPIADDRQWCHVPGYILRNYHACVSTVDVYEDGKLTCAKGEKVGLSLADCMFVIHVMAFKYDTADGKASPSLATIAEYAGIDISNVRRIKARLVTHGLLTVDPTPGKPDEYNFKGLHDQCVRLQEGLSPLADTPVPVTTRKNTGTGKITRGSSRKNTSTPRAFLSAEEREEEAEVKSESATPISNPETTPLPPSIALAIDNAVEKQHNPILNHTGAMMMADVYIRAFEGACKARGAPQRIARTNRNKLIAAQWYEDGYKEDEIYRAVDLLFEAGKPVVFAFLQEKMAQHRNLKDKADSNTNNRGSLDYMLRAAS